MANTVAHNPEHIPDSHWDFVISNYKEFCNLLYNRFYNTLRFYNIINHDFMMVLNPKNRGNQKELKEETLIYAGVESMRELLNANDDNLDKSWNALNEIKLVGAKAKEGSRIYNGFKDDQLTIEDCAKIGDLKNYMAGGAKTDGQKAEFPILEKYFDKEKDHFISLPIFAFGQFEGIVHLVFKDEEIDTSEGAYERRIEIITQIIKIFIVEYESLLFDWDLEDQNSSFLIASRINLEELTSADYYEYLDASVILKELDLHEYYKRSKIYIEERIRQNNVIPQYIANEHRKRAIIAILIDSYAHNVSAHSLTVLNWWFLERAKLLEEENYDFIKYKERIQKIIDETKKISGVLNDLQEERLNAISLYRAPLAKELQPLFKFLLEKGAFWSGVTRGINFGGEINNFFEIIWNDFINNSLYLGTIANSERVNKINVRITVFESYERKNPEENNFDNIKTIKEYEGQKLDGVFAEINLKDAVLPQERKKEDKQQSSYVKKGKLFDTFKKVLESFTVFLPGGVVGKHSFYTLLENEIRNVKHFKGAALEDIQKNGLNLSISIHPRKVDTEGEHVSDKEELLKVGVCLDHPTKISSKLIKSRIKGLWDDIITKDTQEPKLGGSFQDKVCAAMLFNNDFISVQKGSKYEKTRSNSRDFRYYPWLKIGRSIKESENEYKDFEVSSRKYIKIESEFDNIYTETEGCLKKYFHLWRGDFIIHISSKQYWEWENISRFKFINICKRAELEFEKAKRAGVVRILQNLPKDISPEKIYKRWLTNWIKDEEDDNGENEKDGLRIILRQRKTPIGHIVFDEDDGAKYFNNENYKPQASDYGDHKVFDISFEHSSLASDLEFKNSVGNIRTHGVLKEYFFDNVTSIEEFNNATIDHLKLNELIEILVTRLYIFDNRVAERVDDEKREFLDKHLRCGIYREDVNRWNQVKKNIDQFHFLIMHLSFIEALEDENGQKYGEERVVEFIKNEILANRKSNHDNFILVISSGRGRTKWWKEIEKTEYTKFTTFRPIESLINATEKASLKKDDIELKFNLCKVLFGS